MTLDEQQIRQSMSGALALLRAADLAECIGCGVLPSDTHEDECWVPGVIKGLNNGIHAIDERSSMKATEVAI